MREEWKQYDMVCSVILGSDEEEKRIYEDEAYVVAGKKALVPIRT